MSETLKRAAELLRNYGRWAEPLKDGQGTEAMRVAADIERIAQAKPVDVADGWIDPNDKTQKQLLPWVGEAVLFCHDGVTYYGQHTGGSFQTGRGVTARNFNTWECRWMYPPAAAQQEGGA